MDAAVQMLLRHRVVVAHELAAVDHLEDAGRHVEERMAVGVAAFEQQHARAFVHQPRRGDAARRAAADDDVVETLFHCFTWFPVAEACDAGRLRRSRLMP